MESCCFFHAGEEEHEGRSFLFRTFDPDVSFVLQDDRACEAQPDPRTGYLPVYIFLRTVEWFEYLFRFFTVKPFSGIVDFYV